MEKLKFKIGINAPKGKVWDTLWNDRTYPEWTRAFSEGSRAKTDWKQGSKVHFLGAKDEGMYSIIDRVIPNELMSFKHLGVIKDGVELPNDEESKKWSGSNENYLLNEKNGKTELEVELDVTDEFKDYFSDTFPKALERVKDIAENGK
jgi:hypothetical protein